MAFGHGPFGAMVASLPISVNMQWGANVNEQQANSFCVRVHKVSMFDEEMLYKAIGGHIYLTTWAMAEHIQLTFHVHAQLRVHL